MNQLDSLKLADQLLLNAIVFAEREIMFGETPYKVAEDRKERFQLARGGVLRAIEQQEARTGGVDCLEDLVFGLVGQVEMRVTRSEYGADADGNRGVMERDYELRTTTVETDFETDATVPMRVDAVWRDEEQRGEVELEFSLFHLDPETGRAVYAVDLA